MLQVLPVLTALLCLGAGFKDGELATTARKDPASLRGVERMYLVKPRTADFVSLKHCPKLQRLDVKSERPLGRDDLVHLKDLPRLRILKFHEVGVTDGGLAELGDLDGLQKLTLRWKVENTRPTFITETGLAHLVRLQGLRELVVSCGEVHGLTGSTWIRNLAGLEHLRFFYLVTPEGFQEEDLKALGALTQVRKLGVYDSHQKVTDAVLPALAGLNNLESLSLYAALITDEGIRHLQSLKELKCLFLSNCDRITGTGFRHLESLHALTHLNLDGSGITDAGLAGIVRITSLEDLDLGGTNVGKGVPQLQNLPRLKKLWLTGCEHVRTEHVLPLAEVESLWLISVEGTHVAPTDALRKAFADRPLIFTRPGWFPNNGAKNTR